MQIIIIMCRIKMSGLSKLTFLFRHGIIAVLIYTFSLCNLRMNGQYFFIHKGILATLIAIERRELKQNISLPEILD